MGTGEKEPDKIVRFERPFSAELRALYPFLDEYSTGYSIHFPEVPAQTQAAAAPGRPLESMIPDEVHMVIAGAPGKMTFNWRMDGGPETPSTGEESRQRDLQK